MDQDIAAAVTSWRRQIHKNPELGFEEHETAALAEDHLKKLGLEVHSGIARTGVAAILRAPSGGAPAVLLRADMDALPIREVEGREYGSKLEGRMHACGHDGHVAMLLGAAMLLADCREMLPRDVVFCFQPAEEAKGGAEAMIREGVLGDPAVSVRVEPVRHRSRSQVLAGFRRG